MSSAEDWEEEEEEEAPHLGASVEHAKSGRSLCKECRQPISNGALRIGADFVMGDGPAAGKVLVSWRHPACFSLPENECRTIEDLRGFAELSSAQKKAIREAIEGGMALRGEGPAEEEEDEEEEEEEPPPPPPPPKPKATKRKKEAEAAPAPKKAKSAEKKAKATEKAAPLRRSTRNR